MKTSSHIISISLKASKHTFKCYHAQHLFLRDLCGPEIPRGQSPHHYWNCFLCELRNDPRVSPRICSRCFEPNFVRVRGRVLLQRIWMVHGQRSMAIKTLGWRNLCSPPSNQANMGPSTYFWMQTLCGRWGGTCFCFTKNITFVAL